MSQNPDCGGDAAAYVLGALDAHELAAYQRHLQSCSVCQADVESLQQLANSLPMSAPQYQAPKQLRKRVMAEVHADARSRRQTSRPQTVPLAIPRGHVPRYRAGLVGGVTALILVLAVVLVGVTAGGSSKQPAPGPVSSARVYPASTGSGQHIGELIVNGGHGELIVHDLKQLGRSQTYEVWLERPGGSPEPTSALFNVSSNGDGDITVPEDLHGINELLVTREPAGGRAVPTTAPVVVARIS
jgi:anti-sigma factor RsiW